MKKYYNLMLTLVALAMTAMAFTACDEEVKAPTQNPADAFPKKHDTALLLVTFGSTYDVPQQTFEKQKEFFQKQFPNTDLYLSCNVDAKLLEEELQECPCTVFPRYPR